MSLISEIIRWTCLVLCLAAMAGAMWMWLERSRDKGALIFRWVLTAALVAFLWWYVAGCFATKGEANIVGVLAGAVGGCMLAVLWVPSIVDSIGRKFSGLYDGGDDEVEPKPFYSIFRAKRGQGKYLEALAEIRKQLDRFPTDFEGLMLLADLQAKDLKSLPDAETTIQEIIRQPGHAPINIAYALTQMADWHLQLAHDADAARLWLEKIIELLPDTEQALQASQRLGRLAGTEAQLAAPARDRKIRVVPGVKHLGLLASQEHLKPHEIDQEQLAAEYVQQLEKYPLDSHTRETLAVLYANHYQRLDLATEQLEQLIQQPNATAKQRVRWLNLLADLQVRLGADVELVRATLQRIIDQFPELATAENTRRRLETVKLEIKAHRPMSTSVPLGNYEQNLGIKRPA